MSVSLGPRRGVHVNIAEVIGGNGNGVSKEELGHLETFDTIYRSLCALLYNYVPRSGHPGGSVSSGRIVEGLLFDGLDYDMQDPAREDADVISYAAGHKALGLYAMWALRDEIVRLGAPELLPAEETRRLRLEDLLGFRRNPVTDAPLFRELRAKPLDGHPTPATPFVRLATGASGVGMASSLGLAFGARDAFGSCAPRVHVIEGEGGLTPGRVAEALAAAATAGLDNAVVHVDWNQSSIDTDRVCREDNVPGAYVPWSPAELFLLHDWNVIEVPDGLDLRQVLAAQHRAATLPTGQPTAIVYRTVKGWRYGIEGRKSHGAGHDLCSDPFFESVRPLLEKRGARLPTCCDLPARRCSGEDGARVMEECFWESLQVVRETLEVETKMVEAIAQRVREARERLDGRARKPRRDAPRLEAVWEIAGVPPASAAVPASPRAAAASPGAPAPCAPAPVVPPPPLPASLSRKPGEETTLRGELGRVLDHLNRASRGGFLVATADLLGSTSASVIASGFPEGYWHATSNPGARVLATGGICEDAMAGILSGVSTFGRHIGVGASYGAFLAALGHVPSRLHAIGNQARWTAGGGPMRPMILVCAHAGLKTGEDGPTHADPQALQLVQGNFPPGTAITLTPWDPMELWPLVLAALARRPAVIVPFVTRPAEVVLDRVALGLAPPEAAAQGLYRLRATRGRRDGTVVLQGSGVTYAFLQEALPRLDEKGIDLDVFYVASAELFDALPEDERERLYPDEQAREAIGVTGFTLPVLDRWVRSARGRAASLHPFRKGHFLGSGQAAQVLREAGLDGESQVEAIIEHLGRAVRA